MSWLVRSLASQFQDKDKDKEEEDDNGKPKGVKEDLNQLQDALRKQLWGVANFIAPPPSTSNDDDEPSKEIEKEKDGIGEKLKTGFSRISRALPDSKNLQAGIADRLAGVAKFAQEILNVDEHDAVGVTEEVLGFASTVSQHPGTWLNFPLHIIDTAQEFEMSDVQQEHALIIERLIPTLSALRFELCPAYMSEGQFWKIYFVLLHPILNKEDAALLSTPQVLEARALLSTDSFGRNKSDSSSVEKSINEFEKKDEINIEEQSLNHSASLSDYSCMKEPSNAGFPETEKEKNEENEESKKGEKSNLYSEENVISRPEHENLKRQSTADSSDKIDPNDISLDNKKPENAMKADTGLPGVKTDTVIDGNDSKSNPAKVSIASDSKHESEDTEVDDWLHEERNKGDEPSHPVKKETYEDDISFSDLEDDD